MRRVLNEKTVRLIGNEGKKKEPEYIGYKMDL